MIPVEHYLVSCDRKGPNCGACRANGCRRWQREKKRPTEELIKADRFTVLAAPTEPFYVIDEGAA